MKLHNDCALKVMSEMPDGCVDLIVTDPPYKVTSRGGYTSAGGMMLDKDVRKGDVFKHNSVKIDNWLHELHRVLKDGSHCYIMCNNKNLPDFMAAISTSEFHFVKSLIWVKNNKIMSQMYMSQFEYVLFLRKGAAKRVNNCGVSDVLIFDNVKDKDHPTQKPVKLIQLLVEQSSEAGDVVFDPFMGTGSCLIACKNSGRQFVGVELDESYFSLAKNKLVDNHAQQQLI